MKLFHKVYPCPESKSYLLIAHGLFGMLDNWHNLAKSYFSKHINVISVDLRNHGQSPHSEEFSYKNMAEDIAELLLDLDLEQVSLCGHSMGGKMAMAFADLYPEKLQTLIVVDIAPKAYRSNAHSIYFKAFKAIDFSSLQSRKEADDALAFYESNQGVRMFILKNLQKKDVGYGLKLNSKSIEANYEEIRGAIRFSWVNSTPTLFISASRSNYINQEDENTISEHFNNVQFVEIEDAGHWVHAEQPLALYKAVRLFLESNHI